MSTRILSRNSALIIAALAFLGAGYGARAALENVVFPIAELGNCASRSACKAYCDVPDHMVACTQFAQKNKLVSSDQVRRVEKLVSALKSGGPGNCRTPDSCKLYCDDPDHRLECASYAERNGLMAPSPSASPKITPRQTERPRLPSVVPATPKLEPRMETEIEKPRSPIPPEFLNGGATNLPPPPEKPVSQKQSRSFASSLFGLVFRIFMMGSGIGQ